MGIALSLKVLYTTIFYKKQKNQKKIVSLRRNSKQWVARK